MTDKATETAWLIERHDIGPTPCWMAPTGRSGRHWWSCGSYSRYPYKPGSMKRLAARGLVVLIGNYGGVKLWELTEAGFNAP